MKSVVKRFALGMAAALLLTVFLAGCNSEPAAVPIDKRAPDKDITSEARTDKRGDVPQPGAQAGK